MESGEGFVAQLPVLNALSSPFPHLLLLIQHGLLIILATLLHGGLPLCLVLRNQNEGHLMPETRWRQRAASPPVTCPLPHLPQNTHLSVFTCVFSQKHTAHMRNVHTYTHAHNTYNKPIATSPSLPAISTGTGQLLFFENTGSSSFLSYTQK